MHVGSDMLKKIVWANVIKESVKNVIQSFANLGVGVKEDKLVATTTSSPQIYIPNKAEIYALKKTLSDLLDAKTEVEALKKIVKTLQNDNERHQLKIQNIELELKMSNGKAQPAPKEVTEQDTNFGKDSTQIGKRAAKKDVKTPLAKLDIPAKKNSGRTKDLRGAQKPIETQMIAHEVLVTKQMSSVRPSDDATGIGKDMAAFSFYQQGTV